MKISLSMLMFVLFLFLLIAPLHPQAQAETVTDTVNQTEALSQAKDAIISQLFMLLNVVVAGAFVVVGIFAVALYKSVPVAFQGTVLEGLRGFIAIGEKWLQNKAIEAKATPTPYDDKVVSAFLDALQKFGVKFDKDKENTL